MTPPLLHARALSVHLAGRPVLDDFNLELAAGELLVLVGANGSGKSTALRCLAGLLRPSAGTLQLDGQPLAAIDPLQRARQLAYLPQTFRSQWDLQVDELLALGARRSGRQTLPAAALIDALGLQPLLQRRLSQLSGGEQARAALAWALAADSPLLLADEPFAAIDIAQQLALMHYLRSRLPGQSILLVLHDLGLALRFADRIAVLAKGRLLGCQRPAQLRHSGLLEQAFAVDFHWLDSPQGSWPVPACPLPRGD